MSFVSAPGTPDDVQPERGVAALISGGQVAGFRAFGGPLYAIGNQDLCSGAFVLSRVIVGTRDDIPAVVSPLHKQVFACATARASTAGPLTSQSFPSGSATDRSRWR